MSVDYGPSGAALGFPYTPPQGGGGGAVALAGDVTGTSAASVVSELQGEPLKVTAPLSAGEVLAADAGGTAIVNEDIAVVLGYDPAANLTALGIPDPTGAHDGKVVVTAGGAYGLAALPTIPALSSATPQPIGTATAGVSDAAARADHVHAPGVVTTYAFGDATGVTLENGSVGGSAAVSGGKLVLTCPATPQARYETTHLEGPRAVVQLPTANGRRPVRWRVRVRLASIAANVVAYLLMCTSSTTRFGLYTYTAGGGTWALQNNTTNSDLFTGTGFAVDGTGWFELEYDGTEYLYARRGTGSGTAVPTTWTEVGRTSIGTAVLTEARLVAATYATGVARVVEFDDLTFEALP